FVNEHISLEVSLPDGTNPLDLNGQVVWVRTQAPNLWDVGVRFHQIHLMRLQRLFKFSDQIEKPSFV
ncbi:MAG: PilZ domain-containing protein, partial [Planctomycetota bacterium]